MSTARVAKVRARNAPRVPRTRRRISCRPRAVCGCMWLLGPPALKPRSGVAKGFAQPGASGLQRARLHRRTARCRGAEVADRSAAELDQLHGPVQPPTGRQQAREPGRQGMPVGTRNADNDHSHGHHSATHDHHFDHSNDDDQDHPDHASDDVHVDGYYYRAADEPWPRQGTGPWPWTRQGTRKGQGRRTRRRPASTHHADHSDHAVTGAT